MFIFVYSSLVHSLYKGISFFSVVSYWFDGKLQRSEALISVAGEQKQSSGLDPGLFVC